MVELAPLTRMSAWKVAEIKPGDTLIEATDGRVVWDLGPYGDTSGDAPATVNPSLWRQAQLNLIHGLFEVVPGITAAETPEGLHVDCPRGSKMAVLGAMAPLGTALQDLQIQEPSLEDVYFDLRKG